MTVIIIQSTSGLTQTTGLNTGPGLYIMPGSSVGYGILFTGNGNLSALTTQNMLSFSTLSGSGSLSIRPSGRYVTNPATFAGTGSLSALPSGRYATNPAEFDAAGSLSALLAKNFSTNPAVFAGAGSLSAFMQKFISAEFDAAGSLSVANNLALRASIGLKGAGGAGS